MPSYVSFFRNSARAALIAQLGLCAFLGVCITACSGKKTSVEEDCQAKFDLLHAKFEKKKYQSIKEPLSELITSCPGSNFTEQAMFELAETYFNLGDWVEAESEYSAFIKDFPNSRRYGEQAAYRRAVVLAKQVEKPERDQTKTLEAITAFEFFINDFPDSPRADSSGKQVEKLKHQLVDKQMQIAKLYRRMDEPQAAAIYYKQLLLDYGKFANQREIHLKLAECYVDMNQFDEAETYLTKFDGIAKDDPFKEKVKKVYQQLEKARSKLARDKKEEREQGKRQEAL